MFSLKKKKSNLFRWYYKNIERDQQKINVLVFFYFISLMNSYLNIEFRKRKISVVNLVDDLHNSFIVSTKHAYTREKERRELSSNSRWKKLLSVPFFIFLFSI